MPTYDVLNNGSMPNAKGITPPPTVLDFVSADLKTVAKLDLVDLDQPKDAAVLALQGVEKTLRDAQQYLRQQRANSFYVQLAARSDASAVTMRYEMDKATLETIQKNSPDTIAQKAIAAVQAFSLAIKTAKAKQKLPSAVRGFDLARSTRRVELERSLRCMSLVDVLAGYRALVDEGDQDLVSLYEDAAELPATEAVKGGAAKIKAGSPGRDVNAGWATSDFYAATDLLRYISDNRAKRVPAWIAAAEDAYQVIERACSFLCGEHVSFYSQGESARLYQRDGYELPSPYKLRADWSTRWFRPSIPTLADYSPMSRAMSIG